jgi:hypothetical protein
LNGKRDLWRGVPLKTNVCYGNAEARAIVTRAVADYATAHGDVAILHLWLADGNNNYCECPLCHEHLPSDPYVRLLNEVDAELTRRGLPTRIAFLAYVDLLWPPEKERLQNPDRFILMFAPITRTFTTPFTAGVTQTATIPRFVRNRLTFPRTPEENLAFLQGWQHVFHGESFDFDYHLYWDHFRDPGLYAVSQVLYHDIRSLVDLGLDGLISCQVQRCFLPTSLPMVVMGRALWNRDLPFEQIVDDLYRASFGVDGPKVKEYTQALSEEFDPPFLRGERDEPGRRETVRRLEHAVERVQAFIPVVEANLDLPDRCQAQSWRYLRDHADFCLAMAPAVAARARGDLAEARTAGSRLLDLVREQDPRVHRVFDGVMFARTVGRTLAGG